MVVLNYINASVLAEVTIFTWHLAGTSNLLFHEYTYVARHIFHLVLRGGEIEVEQP